MTCSNTGTIRRARDVLVRRLIRSARRRGNRTHAEQHLGLPHCRWDVLDAQLRQPLDTTFKWLQLRLKGLIEEGQAANEIAAELDADEVAAMLVSVIQGGYVLAGASGSAKPFHQAIRGALSLLR